MKYGAFLVENSGIEPLTSCMPCKRSPEPRGHTPHTRLWGRMMIYVKSSCYAFFQLLLHIAQLAALKNNAYFVIGQLQHGVKGDAFGLVHHSDALCFDLLPEIGDGQLIGQLQLVVICRVGKDHGHDAVVDEVVLVDAGHALGDDGFDTEEHRG
mgnify:CR=1 FL=1